MRLAQVGVALLEVVAVAGQAPHRGACPPGRVGLPAEDRAVEAPSRASMSRVFSSLKFQVPGSLTTCAPRCVPRLPDAERPRPADRRAPPCGPPSMTSNGSARTLPPASFAFAAGVVGALDPDVRVPRRPRSARPPAASRSPRRRDRPVVADEVVAGRVGRHAVLELPSEQAAVELGRGRAGRAASVSTQHGTPAGVSVSLEHRALLPSFLDRAHAYERFRSGSVLNVGRMWKSHDRDLEPPADAALAAPGAPRLAGRRARRAARGLRPHDPPRRRAPARRSAIRSSR